MNSDLILVDEEDNKIGILDKELVHIGGYLHRAFSIFIFNNKGELLMQQRAENKYHSANKWSNTCCSHPIEGEDIEFTIQRRLHEEMGISCALQFSFQFIYKAPLDNSMIEHELDYVYMGISNDTPMPSAKEVKNWCYMNLQTLEFNLQNDETLYTSWLKICFKDVKNYFQLHIYPNLKS